MKIKVISLKSAKERRNLFDERFRGFDYEYVDAFKPDFELENESISIGEYGALVSWSKIMVDLLKSKDHRWLIFEDDAIPTDNFDIRLLDEIPERSFFTQLHRHISAERFPYNSVIDELRPTAYCLVSLLVTRAGAEAFLNYRKKHVYVQPDLIVRALSIQDGYSFGFNEPMIRHDFSLKSQVKGDPIYTQPEIWFHEGDQFQ